MTHKILGFLIFAALALIPLEISAQSSCYPSWNCDDIYSSQPSWSNQPSWYDQQEQMRLESELRQLEEQNRYLRALRAQERSERSPNLGGGYDVRFGTTGGGSPLR